MSAIKTALNTLKISTVLKNQFCFDSRILKGVCRKLVMTKDFIMVVVHRIM